MSDPLESGYGVGVAPNFTVPTDWPSRLSVNSGSEPGPNSSIVPKADWRPVTADELTMLTPDTPPETRVALFRLSDELRQRWWKAAESLGLAGDSDAYPAYAREVVEFLRTKDVPVQTDAGCEAVVTVPDRRTTRGGLEFSVDVRRGGGLVGGVNLGDEPTSLVFVNLPPTMLRERVTTQDRWLAKAFLEAFPGYPLVRLRLDPGEGYWLPADGAVFDHWTVGQKEVGVVLGLRATA